MCWSPWSSCNLDSVGACGVCGTLWAVDSVGCGLWAVGCGSLWDSAPVFPYSHFPFSRCVGVLFLSFLSLLLFFRACVVILVGNGLGVRSDVRVQ